MGQNFLLTNSPMWGCTLSTPHPFRPPISLWIDVTVNLAQLCSFSWQFLIESIRQSAVAIKRSHAVSHLIILYITFFEKNPGLATYGLGLPQIFNWI